MSGQWKNSRRRDELPPDWDAIRKRIFRRDGGRCTEIIRDGLRCPNVATDCDHVGDKNDHSDANLTSLCPGHHKAKSSYQGVQARQRRREARFRPPEIHPGTRRPSV